MATIDADVAGGANSSVLALAAPGLIFITWKVDNPISFANVTLENIVSGSRWAVFKTSTGSVLDSGTAAATTVTSALIEKVADFTITVRVRKDSSGGARYLPFETNATFTGAGARVWVSQVPDTVAT
jgi:hypothetical protein